MCNNGALFEFNIIPSPRNIGIGKRVVTLILGFFLAFQCGNALRNKKIVQPMRHCNKHPRKQLANSLKITFVSHYPQYILTTYISSPKEDITIYFRIV
jgi:hypothetical protein